MTTFAFIIIEGILTAIMCWCGVQLYRNILNEGRSNTNYKIRQRRLRGRMMRNISRMQDLEEHKLTTIK